MDRFPPSDEGQGKETPTLLSPLETAYFRHLSSYSEFRTVDKVHMILRIIDLLSYVHIILDQKERLQYLNIPIYFSPAFITYLVLASEQHYFDIIKTEFM
jgi:hypothetical protein